MCIRDRLPPYIHEQLEDQSRYQTVYAREVGSAAAPTAGLHFIPAFQQRIDTCSHICLGIITGHCYTQYFHFSSSSFKFRYLINAENADGIAYFSCTCFLSA